MVLGEAGFGDLTIEPVDEPLYLGPDVDRCYDDLLRLSVVAGSVRDLDDGARAAVLDRLREAVRNKQGPEGVLFGSGSWLVRATAR
jgi:hypothetical protein